MSVRGRLGLLLIIAPCLGLACEAGGASGAHDGADTSADSRRDIDAGGPATTAAVAGTRCPLAERVGVIGLMEESGSLSFSADVHDRANPWYGEPELETAVCAFHRFAPQGACPSCGADQVCGRDGECAAAPVRVDDLAVTVSSGEEEQSFEADGSGQLLWGMVTIGGGPFAFEAHIGQHTVTLGETAVPGALEQLHGTLTGDYAAPEAVDISWSPSESGAQLFTHIPINHHASGPTFTECSADASSGSLHVGEDMLAPLAVVTGLEFQGVRHVHFAAARTPVGCVEIQVGRHIYLDLN